jgi:hypothetical protein
MNQIPFLPQDPLISTVYEDKRMQAAEYTGEVTGTGIKQVMAEPKTPIHLITPQFIEGVAAILQHGANKYAPNNWMAGMSWSTVFGGVMRHLWAWFRGEELDPESGLPHLCHAACGIMFLHWYCHGPAREAHTDKCDDRMYFA